MMDIIIVTVEGVTNDGDIIASKVEIIDTEAETVTKDGTIDEDILKYYKRRFPLTTEAMGL